MQKPASRSSLGQGSLATSGDKSHFFDQKSTPGALATKRNRWLRTAKDFH